jgi:hypothetical protein
MTLHGPADTCWTNNSAATSTVSPKISRFLIISSDITGHSPGVSEDRTNLIGIKWHFPHTGDLVEQVTYSLVTSRYAQRQWNQNIAKQYV